LGRLGKEDLFLKRKKGKSHSENDIQGQGPPINPFSNLQKEGKEGKSDTCRSEKRRRKETIRKEIGTRREKRKADFHTCLISESPFLRGKNRGASTAGRETSGGFQRKGRAAGCP